MRKRLLIPVAVLIAAGLAGGAYAAGQGGSDPQQAFINDAAHRLHVTPGQLSGALKQALIDRINAAAAAGQISHAQAKQIVTSIEHGNGPPFGPGPLMFGPGPKVVRMFGPGSKAIRMFAPAPFPMMFGASRGTLRMFGRGQAAFPPFGPPAILTGAASYLGLSGKQLMRELSQGKSLAQIAQAQGKTKSGLEQAIMAAVSSQLEKVTKAGRGIPHAFEQRLEARIRQSLPAILTMSPHVQKLPAGGQIRVAPGLPFPFLGLLGLIPRFQIQHP